ncbi:MAG: ribosomal protein S18-alanine N-acetyltransferase [Betaproteobacteria bacterium]|nr:ribosomal protein S18-alanine N-acetyltransferase [Betaproteobacteria bacterium]
MSAVLAVPQLPPIQWQPLREEDMADVAAIEASVYVFPWTIGNFRDSLLSGYQCTGGWIQGELIAYAIVMTALEEAHLLNIAVASRWQGRGVGALFLQHLIEDLRKQQIEMLYLEVRPSNTHARQMYDRFGFRQLGLRRDYYPAVTGREDALFLGLNLGEN